MKYAILASALMITPMVFAADDEAAAARKQLQGVWKGRVHDGATGHEITISPEVISGVKDGTRDLGKGSYTLDLQSRPWRLDAKEIKKDGAEGKQYFGIYKLDGDSLTWCVGTKEAPTKFATGDGTFMLVLKRQAPSKSSSE